MTKHFISMLILSVLAILFIKELDHVLYVFGYSQAFLSAETSDLLPEFQISVFIGNIIALIVIPIIIGYVLPFIYKFFVQKKIFKSTEFIWIFWIISLVIFVIYK